MLVRRGLTCVVALASIALAAPPAMATAGGTLWTATYNGPTNGPDTPVAMAIDPNGRAYVAGTTGNDETADIVTIAYDIYTGAKIWARRYDGPAHGADLGVAIAYNQSSGGVVVTGMSESVAGTGRIDAVTISYQPDGTQAWTRRASSSGTDAPSGLAVSGGYTYLLLHGTHGRLVAYDFAGDRIWAHRLTDETLLGLVGLRMIGGYLMATGTVSHPAGSAMFTTTFTQFGVPVWNKTFGGPAHDAIASDSDVGGGTVLYVTGSYTDGTTRKITTMGYEPHDGFRFWRRSIAPQTPTDFDVKPHVAVSSDGAVIAVAATSTHLSVSTFLTREYKADGSILWTARENGPNDSGEVTDVVASGFGNTSVNVYVVGQGTNTGGQEGAFLVAYGSMGPPSTFEKLVPPTNVDDVSRIVDTGSFGDRVVVASRVGGDIRVDAYSQY
jgi:PQQ-like domain